MSLKDIIALSRRLLANRALKSMLIAAIVLVTALAFTHFFVQHPEYLHQLGRVNPWVTVAVVALNIPQLFCLLMIYNACIRLCGKRLGLQENFLLTAYSSIVNFFGPLQSGPGVRAAYLKTRHQIRLRDYTLASLLYYGLFAFFSALFLLAGSRPWWQTIIGLLVVSIISWRVVRWFRHRDAQPATSHFRLDGAALTSLVIFTFLQVLFLAITYFVELRAVNSHIMWSQAVSYTGAANFSLFVSLTPDAVGFREAFLLFSRHLHHVATGNIVTANIIDRGAYLIFLVLLALVVVTVHAKARLQLKTPKDGPKDYS